MRWVDKIANVMHGVERRIAGEDAIYGLEDFERFVQLDDFSCGAKSAFSILSYFGKTRSLARVEQLLGTDEDGTAVGPMLKLFRQRGLTARIKDNATMRDLEHGLRAGNAALISVDDGKHWSVAYAYTRSHIFIADPSPKSLRCRIPRQRFQQRWDRWVAFVGP